MWVEVFNVEKSGSVDEADENSTVILAWHGKGAGTNPRVNQRNLRRRLYVGGLTAFALTIFPTQDGSRSSAKADFHRGKPGGGVFFKLDGLLSPPENINRLEIPLQDLAGFTLEPMLNHSRIDLTKIGVMLEISVLKLLQTR